jgi:hypothetical protein
VNNEPVAWRNLCVSNIGEDSEWIYNEIGQGEPLYTHPVKELTDEEINDIAQQCWVYPQGEQAIFNQHKFARAILRKAQEK